MRGGRQAGTQRLVLRQCGQEGRIEDVAGADRVDDADIGRHGFDKRSVRTDGDSAARSALDDEGRALPHAGADRTRGLLRAWHSRQGHRLDFIEQRQRAT